MYVQFKPAPQAGVDVPKERKPWCAPNTQEEMLMLNITVVMVYFKPPDFYAATPVLQCINAQGTSNKSTIELLVRHVAAELVGVVCLIETSTIVIVGSASATTSCGLG